LGAAQSGLNGFIGVGIGVAIRFGIAAAFLIPISTATPFCLAPAALQLLVNKQTYWPSIAQWLRFLEVDALDDCGLLLPAALFIFLTAAAMAGGIPADSRLVAAKGLIGHTAIDKSPRSSFFAEGRDLVVIHPLIFLGISRDKLDASLVIAFFSVDYIKYLKTMPLGLFGPFACALAVEFSPGAGIDGSLDKVDVGRGESGIPRAHQSFGRWSVTHAVEKRFTTLTKWFVTSAGAIGHLVCSYPLSSSK
jgi:hypothetical protein